MTNIIVEKKTERTSLFEFPSNETGVEGINLTPVMGQKTNDQKENKDKEGNCEEDNGETKVIEKDGKNNENENDEEKNNDEAKEINNHEETI
uniref:Uncharacterized protein n=1 Tax=Lactuca sativa TaxID=4236 RepID=A0A9R1VNM9_LACSA|nr:hypothetical protein LSAT_V11C500259010 [Lactuca sativa]